MTSLPQAKAITEGDHVVTADGKQLGVVKEIKAERFKVDVRWAPDYWLGTDIVESADQGIVQLFLTKEGVGPAKLHDIDKIDGSSLPSAQ